LTGNVDFWLDDDKNGPFLIIFQPKPQNYLPFYTFSRNFLPNFPSKFL